MNIFTIILIIVGVAALWLVAAYNRFVALRNRAKEAWSDIDVQLKRRYDLIPNLVETVKGYAAHEQQVQAVGGVVVAQCAHHHRTAVDGAPCRQADQFARHVVGAGHADHQRRRRVSKGRGRKFGKHKELEKESILTIIRIGNSRFIIPKLQKNP